ncbi:hypothetical protein, partial [Sphingobacterium siyangense]|uniref:hypothetical protein n=1 Tax=Sphingobacterium siyangense TaxID=459529 RepID=UPI003C78D311
YGNITDLRTSVDSINRFFRLSNKKGTYFANCYNTGKITGQYSVYTDGLVGHYGWRWRDAVYLLDRQGDRCYWSDSSIVVYQLETQRLPRDLRSFETSVEKDIYNVRSPKVFQKIANVDMRAELFVTMLNQWVNKHGLPFKQWEVDKVNVNGGYPIFE